MEVIGGLILIGIYFIISFIMMKGYEYFFPFVQDLNATCEVQSIAVYKYEETLSNILFGGPITLLFVIIVVGNLIRETLEFFEKKFQKN